MYMEREGHCRVPQLHKENGFPLGQWANRRRNKESLSELRQQQLDKLGFVWDPLAAAWQEGFRIGGPDPHSSRTTMRRSTSLMGRKHQAALGLLLVPGQAEQPGRAGRDEGTRLVQGQDEPAERFSKA
jgi:hypothetical protein